MKMGVILRKWVWCKLNTSLVPRPPAPSRGLVQKLDSGLDSTHGLDYGLIVGLE